MFVDDEPQVLKGITRMLDCADVMWDVETATSGPEALEVLQKEPVDVLVVDMKMPGMDGAELLAEVSQRYPQTVRIILSGQASKESVYRAVAPMHQYLAKPCETDVLRTTISRACALRAHLEKTTSQAFLGRISLLPSIPSLYQQVVAETESEQGTAARVGEIVARDPAMTAKILQLVNSAIFGLRSTVTSVAHAVSIIGTDTLNSLVLSLQAFQAFAGIRVPGFSMDVFASHCVRVGTIARTIAASERLGKILVDEAFSAGLLHDIGKLILASNAPEDFSAALRTAETSGIPLVEAERKLFGLGHDGIGGYLLALWGIPQTVVESVTFHHSFQQCGGRSLDTPAIVCVANFLANEENGIVSAEDTRLCEALLSELRLPDRLDVWRNAIRGENK
ncbi:MAG: response regulator [Fuerstiella sp.]